MRVLQAAAGCRQAFTEFRLHPVEGIRIGALERIDRLFLVADHEDRADDVISRAPARW